MKTVFENENIEFCGVIPFAACKCRRPDIIERKGVRAEDIQSAIMFLVPYYVSDGSGNISLYARSGDYHAYCDALFERILPALEEKYGGRFLGFADKSPIEENVAASMAGLGVLGDHYMLINEKYGTFVFLAEILSTLPPEALGYTERPLAPSYCIHCGACKKACPMVIDGMECLSALTQKKGTLTDAEKELADGWEEYRTERADAEQELADAYQELTDAEQELADGFADYEQGKLDIRICW